MRDKKMKLFIISVVFLLGIVVAVWNMRNKSNPMPVQTANTELTEFYYSHRGSMVDDIYSYEVKSDESSPTGFTVIFNLNCGYDVYSTPADARLIENVLALIGECELHQWNGFNESDSMILDGSGFSLDVVYANGTEIHAHGNNSFPAGYR